MRRTSIWWLVVLALLTGCAGAADQEAPAVVESSPGVSVIAPPPAEERKGPSPYEQAQEFLKAGNVGDALPLLEEAVAADPQHAAAFIDLCFVYIRVKWWQEAVEAGQRAYRLDPENSAVAFNLGRAHLGAKQYDMAIAYLDLAYRKNRENADVAWFLGQAYEGGGQPLLALDIYRQALVARPGDTHFEPAVSRLQAELDAQRAVILRADLAGNGRQAEIWTQPGELHVVDSAGKELLALTRESTRRHTEYKAEVMDLGVPVPVLWVSAGPGCPGGWEHGLYAFDKASGVMKELVWHGCATVVDFNKETHSVNFATRVMPSYVTTTYTFDGTNLVEEGAVESLAFVWPTNVDLALEKILGQGYDEGLFRDQTVADAFLAAWSGADTRVTVTGPEVSGSEFTGEVTITQGARTARGTIHMVEAEGKWYIDRLDLALPAR